MRHQRTGKRLGRDSAHRKALYANLAGALIEHGRIRTTVTKAKAVKPLAEQMITLGRRGDLHARRQAVAVLRSKDIVHKLFDEIGPRFADRPGGYSRIVKIGPRAGDAAEMVYLELVDEPHVPRERPAVSASPAAVAAAEVETAEAEAEAPEAAAGEPEAEAVSDAESAEETGPAAEAEPAAEVEPAAEAGPAADADAPSDAGDDAAADEAAATPES